MPDVFSSMKMSDATVTVFITDTALAAIVHEAHQSLDGLEIGGILLGTETANGIVIRHAGGAGPNAHRGANFFLRDLTYAQQIAEAAWEADQSQWIGEWHTHPTGGFAPSEVDLGSYTRHVHDQELGFRQFIAVIACFNASAEIVVATWQIEQNGVRPVQLMRLAENTPLHGGFDSDETSRPGNHTHES